MAYFGNYWLGAAGQQAQPAQPAGDSGAKDEGRETGRAAAGGVAVGAAGPLGGGIGGMMGGGHPGMGGVMSGGVGATGPSTGARAAMAVMDEIMAGARGGSGEAPDPRAQPPRPGRKYSEMSFEEKLAYREAEKVRMAFRYEHSQQAAMRVKAVEAWRAGERRGFFPGPR